MAVSHSRIVVRACLWLGTLSPLAEGLNTQVASSIQASTTSTSSFLSKTLPPRNYAGLSQTHAGKTQGANKASAAPDASYISFGNMGTNMTQVNANILGRQNGKGKLVVFYSTWCPDCKKFHKPWNRLPEAFSKVELGGEPLTSSVEFLAVNDNDYTAPKPFFHYEIPCVYYVDSKAFGGSAASSTLSLLATSTNDTAKFLGKHTTKFEKDSLGAYLDGKILEGDIIGELQNFVLEKQGAAMNLVIKLTSSGKVDDGAKNSKNSKTISVDFPTAISLKNSQKNAVETKVKKEIADYEKSAENSPTKILAILAEHPGKEKEILQSKEYVNMPVAKYVLTHWKTNETGIEQAAKYFDGLNEVKK